MAETPVERLVEVKREIDAFDQIPEYLWDRRTLNDLVLEHASLEAEVYGDPKERIRLKHQLRRAGVPYDMWAPMADLKALLALIPRLVEA